MIRRGALSCAALSLFLMGCIGDPDTPAHDAPRAKWEKNEPALYAYTVEHICFCIGGPVHVIASRESVLVAEPGGPARGTLTEPLSPQDYSIESLFDEVDKQLQRPHDDVRLSFDATYGFPASVHIDFEKQMADEEYGLVISDFRPVNAVSAFVLP